MGVAEIGDKSLFLTILLIIRYQRPLLVLLGLVAGISANLALAAGVGTLLADWLASDVLGWVLGASFLAMAAWSLFPESQQPPDPTSSGGQFMTVAVSYLLLEMADKTQLATLALAARFDVFLPVLAGGVLGVVMVNAPAIWLGQRFAGRLPMTRIRWLSALLFLLIGLWILLEVSGVVA